MNTKLHRALHEEIKILQKIQFPHVVALYRFAEDAAYMHLIMEYCPWGDLSGFLRREEIGIRHRGLDEIFKRYPSPSRGGINQVLILHALQQIAAALEFMRGMDLIHRDIKPQNVLVCPSLVWLQRQGEDNEKWGLTDQNQLMPLAGIPSLPIIKLADFGFARYLPKTSLADTMCGSPLYMAPEILASKQYDQTADLWSVGIMLYELSYGRTPFRASNHVELFKKIDRVGGVTKFPESPHISPELRTFMASLLRQEPVERLDYAGFLSSPLVKGEIPGLLDEDKPRKFLPVPSRDLKGSEASDKFVDAVDYVASPNRPPIHHNATAPAGHIRKPAPLPSLPAKPVVTGPEQTRETKEKQRQEQTAQEMIAFERDYVMVEKRNVEVNALADEMAASPRVHSGRAQAQIQSTALQRRNTTQNTPPSVGQILQSIPNSRAVQLVSGRRTDHVRQPSFEKKTKIGYRVSNVINAASGRLLGLGFSPPLGLGRAGPSPPLYTAYPAYPSTPATLLLEDARQSPVDEDTRALTLIEEFAHRSDVVYCFAEVKFKQLIPLAPSEDKGNLGAQLASPLKDDDDDDGGLTVDAVAILAEEALVLYIKALSLLARTMDVAGSWWSKKNKGDDGSANKLVTTPAGIRINKIIQWTRNRFNEVWEKTEFVRMKLGSAQKRLPVDHPMHPDNFPSESSSMASGDIRISPGISAEQLMYTRAWEMGRAAACDELIGKDLPGCELSYITAIRMLEAILEIDGDSSIAREKPASNTTFEDESIVDAEDKNSIETGKSIVSKLFTR